ncbi:MAG: PH domain-containing protein [Spirochaetes bacterium]|nr:PH domain-containing protein [Spirochaetota bacterium]HPA71160.1 hypothetical protein [Spirochaetota bacterium]
MMTNTTINLGAECLDKLVRVSLNTGISRSALVSSLLKQAGTRITKRFENGAAVRYQERRSKDKWKRVHLSLRRDEYEYCIDLRKVKKLSVSFIIAIAIEQFLDDLIIKMKDNPDNYRYRNYVIICNTEKNVTNINIYWGIPPEMNG